MITPFLEQLFRNYFLTVASCHQYERADVFRAPPEDAVVDCFAHLPNLNSWVLCWSNTGPATVNRVFIPDSHADFAAMAGARPAKVVIVNRRQHHAAPGDTDLTLALYRKGANSVAYVPLVHSNLTFGVIRIVANLEQIRRLRVFKGGPGYESAGEIEPFLPDPGLVPHILGRWGGNLFGQGEKTKALDVLLKAFASFFSRAHDKYFERDFNSDELRFFHSSNPTTSMLFSGLCTSIRSHKYMFSIVAEQGASEMLKNFPDDLGKGVRVNSSGWQRNPLYERMLNDLGTQESSYIGIPLKVDDAVIGVITMLVARFETNFFAAARFIRATVAEMGKTIDKGAISRTANIIRRFAASKLSASGERIHLPTLGRELVKNLVDELLPFGKVKVGFHEARLGAPAGDDGGIDQEASSLIKQELLRAIVSERISLHVYRPPDKSNPTFGVTLVPFPGALPFILSVTGPLALLTGRSLRAALEQLQSVLIVALAASEQLASGFDIVNWRAHLALWAQVHDLKNMAASFNRPLRELVGTAENGTHEDLKIEVFRFNHQFATVVRDFEMECDRVLRGAEFRKLGKIQIASVVANAWTVIRTYPEAFRKCKANFQGDSTIEAFTYESELKIVLENIFMNVIKHFQRMTSYGETTISVESSDDDTEIIIKIWDSVEEDGALPRVKALLNSDDSQQTLSRFVKPIVQRLLNGYIWAEDSPLGTLSIVLKIPRRLKPR